MPFIALGMAMLGAILVFMDQQITVVIVNRKENLLKKGCGFHLDLLVCGLLIGVCSLFGFPWCEASTVPSINHVNSLQKESESAVPGEKPKFLGVREQRVTPLLVHVLIGVSIFMAPILNRVPMPVLFGIFLYMGVSATQGLQVVDRLLLFLMPEKYQPDQPYLRRIPIKRVHTFTAIQMACLLTLGFINYVNKYVAMWLPLFVSRHKTWGNFSL